MNDEMYAHPATQANLARLVERGFRLVGPEKGSLAEGPSDRPGRMSEPDTIMAHAARLLSGGSWRGRHILVTAGPTREAIDPVRIITNRSSGKMGYRLAEAAWVRGAEVTLISGPTGLAAPTGVRVVSVESTAEMQDAVKLALPGADVLIMAAAPADFRPRKVARTKLPRTEGATPVSFEPTPDILVSTQNSRKPGSVIVGFALETGEGTDRALAKLDRKKLDLIVLNDALEPGAGFEVDTNRVTILARNEPPRVLPLLSKRQVADAVLDAVEARLV
jgi:phosphopantothenoylcysteine decarboxylase/phosphopantothenate--cysteine ligase